MTRISGELSLAGAAKLGSDMMREKTICFSHQGIKQTAISDECTDRSDGKQK
jgi:hypothetical protein